MKAAFVFGCLVLAVACGGGGDDGGTPETGYVFLQAAPSEETLCSFVVGETTMGQVMDVLGEPTNYSESPTGSLLQYWIGRESLLGTAPPRALMLGFDSGGRLDFQSVQQVPYPQCWREQMDASGSAP